jgi:hypothetical protein
MQVFRGNIMKPSFDIYNHPAVKRVSVYALMLEGDLVGRVIVAYPNDGAGIVRASVAAWKGSLAGFDRMNGSAGGYGYDKRTTAVHDALYRAKVPGLVAFDGRGETCMEDAFKGMGYQLVSVL